MKYVTARYIVDSIIKDLQNHYMIRETWKELMPEQIEKTQQKWQNRILDIANYEHKVLGDSEYE